MQIITRKARLVCGNPYVTDGLVAHFDGIWNAGLGRHDAAAREWTNLVTGEATVSTGQTNFSDNGLVIASRDNRIDLNTPSARTAVKRGEFTIEIVGFIEAFTATRFFWLSDSTASVPDAIRLMTHNTAGLFITAQLGDILHVVSHGRDTAPCAGYGNVVCHLSDLSMPNVHFYKNGSYCTRRLCSANLHPKGLYIVSAASGPTGLYHALRIYNRPLTQAEIERNYEIDKVRFHSD